MRKKKMVILMALILCSFIPLISAQEVLGLQILPGETVEGDMLVVDETASTTIGAVISQIEFSFERFINFLGETVWKDASNEMKDFELLAFPQSSLFGGNTIIYDGIFEETELISIRNTSENVWETNNIHFDVDIETQPIQIVDPTAQRVVLFDDNTAIAITDFNGITGNYLWGLSGVPEIAGNNLQTFDCNEIMPCPSEVDIETMFEIDVDYSTIKIVYAPTPNKHLIIVKDISSTTEYVFGDLNNNMFFELVSQVNGFAVSSFEGQALGIFEIGTYDLYGEIII